MTNQPSQRLRWTGIVIGASLPSLITWCYFVLLSASSPALQQSTYFVGKVCQFAFPAVWVLLALHKRLGHSGLAGIEPSSSRGLSGAPNFLLSVGLGSGVVVAMFAIYHYGLSPSVQAQLVAQVVEKVRGFDLDSWGKFVALATFYAVAHSLLEEYYYRWFLYGQLRYVVKPGPAMAVSGLAFMAHHVIVLGHYFGPTSLITALLSTCIAMGGIIWAWQYEHSRSLAGPWLSHFIVDAGIFALGYQVLLAAEAI